LVARATVYYCSSAEAGASWSLKEEGGKKFGHRTITLFLSSRHQYQFRNSLV
jgi:hypothetical protein